MARKKSDLPLAPDADPGRFGILIRHSGFIDRIARKAPADSYYKSEDNINHWTGHDSHELLRFPTREAAQCGADRLAEMFGELRYRFSVIEERPVPRWFLVEPEPGWARENPRWERRSPMSQPKQHATITVPSLKLAVPLRASQLPADLVPADGPAGEPTIDVVLEGGSLTVRAKLNGKNLRKNLRLIAEHGPDSVAVVLQGTLRPPAGAGGPYVLESAGLQVNVKTSKPSPEATHET
jgi:hypothetical protein